MHHERTLFANDVTLFIYNIVTSLLNLHTALTHFAILVLHVNSAKGKVSSAPLQMISTIKVIHRPTISISESVVPVYSGAVFL